MENIAEILQNAPQGLELYSPVYGKINLRKYTDNVFPIVCTDIEDAYRFFTSSGKFRDDFDSECILFPSKEHKTWDNWQKILFKPGDFIICDVVNISENQQNVCCIYNGFNEHYNDYVGYFLCHEGITAKNLNKQILLENARYATPEEREQFMAELNANGYKWNADTKQIEKIEQQNTPKYKVGDWIKFNDSLCEITNIEDYRYELFYYSTKYKVTVFINEVDTNAVTATEQELIDAGIKCSNSEHNTNIDNLLKNNTFYYPEQETEVEVTPNGCYKCVLKTEKKNPKFSIGDYIVGDNETIYKIMDIHSALYTLYDYSNRNKFKQTIKKIDENYSLVTDQELIDAGIKSQHHKFKAGDVIRNKETGIVCKINYLAKNWYIFYKNKNQSGLKYENEDKWELVTEHKTKSESHYITPHRVFFNWIFDRLVNVHGENPSVDYMQSLKERIDDLFPETEETNTTSKPTEEKSFTIEDLKPFDKVLVRDWFYGKWTCDIYKHYDETDKHYKCLISSWERCIPYNDETAHLLNTTDDCPEKYKTWEEEL